MHLWDRSFDSHQTLWQVLVTYTFVNSCIKVPVPLIQTVPLIQIHSKSVLQVGAEVSI